MKSSQYHILSLIVFIMMTGTQLQADTVTFEATHQYLNIPISHKCQREIMTYKIDDVKELEVEVRLAIDEIDYWVFRDISDFKGKNITIDYPADGKTLARIFQSDTIVGESTIYHEANRPQYHFSARRGWINDPNGLIYHNGEYHLYYQHNPYEREWGNMHWGHAVSKDLIHWQELPIALYPDHLGTMFSGSAVYDRENTSGFGTKNNPPLVIAYTADSPERQVQCIAYSTDNGRTFTKYEGNPVLNTREKWNSHDTRDPRLFRYEPGNHWVMVLHERDGHSIYTSKNLKDWSYQSHVTGFWECPELIELYVDGDPLKKKWVMYGASGTYMIGTFDGKVFTPESGKHCYTTGSIYAAQTINNTPNSEGKRIQIGWGRIAHQDMPFNGVMLLPTELQLRTTKDGIRLVSYPIKETEKLFEQQGKWQALEMTEANNILSQYSKEKGLRIKTTIKLSHAIDAGLILNEQKILNYDTNNTLLNGHFYSPQIPTSMELTADIYIDRTTIEVFIDGGLYSYSLEHRPNKEGTSRLEFWGRQIEIVNLEIFTAHSIW